MKKDENYFDFQGCVIEFMNASGQTVNKVPTEMTIDQADLRYKLYLEEVLELREAVMQQDKVEQLDAVVDILYIALGTAATAGDILNVEAQLAIDFCALKKGRSTMDMLSYLENLPVGDYNDAIWNTVILAHDLGFSGKQIQDAFEQVHKNNMSKFCYSEEDAKMSVQQYSSQGIDAVWVKRGDLYVILRAEDGKILKGHNYIKVDLTGFV